MAEIRVVLADDNIQVLDATAQNGPEQGHGFPRGEAPADRNDSAILDPGSETCERGPLIGVRIDGPRFGLGHCLPPLVKCEAARGFTPQARVKILWEGSPLSSEQIWWLAVACDHPRPWAMSSDEGGSK